MVYECKPHPAVLAAGRPDGEIARGNLRGRLAERRARTTFCQFDEEPNDSRHARGLRGNRFETRRTSRDDRFQRSIDRDATIPR